MTPDPDRSETLLSVADEIEAAAIVGYLDQCGIRAFAAGGYTSGFKAEAPGDVKILVKQADLDRARKALAENQEHESVVDWSNVDVTKQEEEQQPANKGAGADGNQCVVMNYSWLILELLGITICLIIWLFTRDLAPLTYAVTAVVFIGLVYKMSRRLILRH
ncbi:MAG: DUF2007 domain-containing protein [Planctomycetes bacterium]|nr:DUF2007 domain-containing protein [Planctomycetota bacterium]MBU4399095.1 DUF2007 domain-containing protein [Planctomycetota bacterium]MCG2682948.1 DUF2007 domain-containing protein [Planctomycetales bacterium]